MTILNLLAVIRAFGLMRIKDSKAMHFISIKQITRWRGRGERRRGGEGRNTIISNQQAGK